MALSHRFLLAASFLYLAIANIIWIARDARPPFWDMADKQTAALRIYDAFANAGIRAFADIPFLTGSYPPFYHSILAVFYSVFGRTIDAAQWANLAAVILLFTSTYGIGITLLKPLPAAAAAALVNFYPILLWLSRETLIDYWLTSMVALAMWVLIRTNEFANRRASVVFGIVCGLGMLTKWTFVFFLILPALWFARKNVKNAGIAAVLAGIIAAYWYVPAGRMLAPLLSVNVRQSVGEGDPNPASLQAVIFYIRALEGYQLFLPLFLAFIGGAILLARKFDRRWIPIILWIGGGWLFLMFFQNKDPRYSAPLLPAVALITAQIFQRRQILIAVLIPVLLVQHYLVSFGIRQLPPSVVLAKGVDGPLAWHWNVYTQQYFDLWGPPAKEDWKIEHVLQTVSSIRNGPTRIGIVPDIPRFDSLAFQFYVTLHRLPVTVHRLFAFDQNALAYCHFILVSEKHSGFEAGSDYSGDLRAINQHVFAHPDAFRLVESFSLPNGDVIRLYKVGNS